MAGKYLLKNNKSQIFNCGYGKGYSVLDVSQYEFYLTKKIPIIFGKRPNDIKSSISNTKKFNKYIKWKPRFDNLKYILKTSMNGKKLKNNKI